uniref:Uncharacterized protein n=1 Tax=Nelumbo nucifera TaxID=4432 RepID=A0A822ZK16_NELNU|nr:TPA_asm: hypothetical protein HUJ06_003447 [Nelumbo nucifera]
MGAQICYPHPTNKSLELFIENISCTCLLSFMREMHGF